MIGKTTIGTSFGGCVRYQFEGHKNSQEEKRAEVLEAVGVRADSAASMTADFNRGRKLNPELGRAVWHTSISFNPDDAPRLTNEKMLAVAHDYVAGMGLDRTQYAIIRHHDKEHPHFHIIANRVANDGQTISDSHNYKRSEHLLKQLSQKHELTPVQGKRPDRIHEEQLRGADKTKHEIYQAAHRALDGCQSAQQFADRMREQGITYQVRRNAAGKQTGISFEKGGHCFKGSEIDRKLSLSGIVSQIERNRPKVPQLSEVERKWQSEYNQYAERQQGQNAQIRAANEWIGKAAEQLRQNPSVDVARQLKQQAPSYALQQSLDQQVKDYEAHQRRSQWAQAQRQELTRQAGQWFGLSEKAREARQKLAYLDNPQGSGLYYQMQEKHYDFWIYAKDADQPQPRFSISPPLYQKPEQPVLSLKEFAQQREAAEQKRQAQEIERQRQQEQRQQRGQNRGPRMGM
ncbi:relaxase/mobilization nuclease domain-containing protein [Rudanella paleaurantiibacter]|uniref:Relaxase/mobilization nuclease domain-containing protein n=1 Tax=Rudanella paleaurantiibacter TaxID=2614655 RepID=A0A7J5TRL9_9BACT|nr:relaxase/mobilization nuclease domain-containing protein [Rudanella paleaurantiibacter]KAB7725231.1 relaxase/mobilization nuclease domain-containing protein [Rudanella paleaurantiibacter]